MVSYYFAPKFYRKPEIYRYAHAEKIDKQPVIDGKMTIEQYNDIQYNANIESMELRTHDEISGKLKYPSAFQKI